MQGDLWSTVSARLHQLLAEDPALELIFGVNSLLPLVIPALASHATQVRIPVKWDLLKKSGVSLEDCNITILPLLD